VHSEPGYPDAVVILQSDGTLELVNIPLDMLAPHWGDTTPTDWSESVDASGTWSNVPDGDVEITFRFTPDDSRHLTALSPGRDSVGTYLTLVYDADANKEVRFYEADKSPSLSVAPRLTMRSRTTRLGSSKRWRT
jgi:hypothetical protein